MACKLGGDALKFCAGVKLFDLDVVGFDLLHCPIGVGRFEHGQLIRGHVHIQGRGFVARDEQAEMGDDGHGRYL